MSDSLLYRSACSVCKKDLGPMSKDEFQHLYTADVPEDKCFDCEVPPGEQLPEMFKELKQGEFVGIGDVVFLVSPQSGRLLILDVSRSRVRMRSRVLSSYTYLNGLRVFSGQGLLVKVCPRCQGDSVSGILGCTRCENMGTVITEILVPAWLIGGQGENV